MRKHYRWWATAAALVVGLIFVSVQQTSARWTDSATLSGGTITAGVLDLTVGGAGSSYDFTALGATGMFPNSYAQAPLTIRNSGSVPLNYRLENVVQTQSDVPLTLTLSKVNAEGDCPKQAAPTNATQIYTGAMSGAQVPTAPAWRTLAPNTSEVLCIRGTVGAAAEPGKSTSVVFTFAAESK